MNVYTKKRNIWQQKYLASIGGAILLIILLNIFQSQAKNAFYYVSYPVSEVSINFGQKISGFFGGLLGAGNIQQENNDLKTKNQDLLSEISSLKSIIKENQDLKIALENTKNSNFNLVISKIVGLDLQNDLFLIDKGLDDGVQDNMPVISNEKVIYGKVLKAYKNFSQVVLISRKNDAFEVKVQRDQDQKTIYGVLRGKGNQSVYMDLVNFDAEINEGDLLVSSGLEGSFPKDLLVGHVTSFNKSDLKPFQTAEVKPLLDFQSIEDLFVITNYLPAPAGLPERKSSQSGAKAGGQAGKK